MIRKLYRFLSSAKLAIALLVTILACCVAGVTVWRGVEAGKVIFGTLWFNGLLVLLVVNIACCFFPRMRGRKLTLISVGMILFHLSFLSILAGIVYNSFFSFRGLIRLTEGEILPSGDPQSYDVLEKGRYFDFSRLRGETSLIKMHRKYKVDGKDKVAAYEIAVGEEAFKKQGIIYITEHLDYNGFRYFPEKEGYSVLVILYDRHGREFYGAHIPLQSLRQQDGTYLYTTGTSEGPGSLPFPQSPLSPLFNLQVAYHPDPGKERAGNASFKVWPLEDPHAQESGKPLAEGSAAVGGMFDAGDHDLSVREIRYWTGMFVRYDPGLPIVLTSLWVGLGGMVLTFIGRIRKRRIERKAASTPDV